MREKRDESADEVRLWADTKLRNCGEYRKIKVGQSLSFSSSFILPLALRWLWQTAHSLSPSIESITMSNDPRSPSPSGLYRGRSGVDIKERERANGESNNRMFRWTFLVFRSFVVFFLKQNQEENAVFERIHLRLFVVSSSWLCVRVFHVVHISHLNLNSSWSFSLFLFCLQKKSQRPLADVPSWWSLSSCPFFFFVFPLLTSAVGRIFFFFF